MNALQIASPCAKAAALVKTFAMVVHFLLFIMLSYAFSFGTAPLCDRVLAALIHTETNT